MENIHFCRDGVLRRAVTVFDPAGERHVSRLVPLRAWEEAVDPSAFLTALHANILLEDGLTVAHLMENLAPWSERMAGLACMDFRGFLTEMRRSPDRMTEEVSHIALRYRGSIEPVPAFEPSVSPFRETKEGLRRFDPGKRLFSGRLELRQGWHGHAILKPGAGAEYGGAESISLSFTPMPEWKHLPIRIENTGMLFDGTVSGSSATFLGTRKPLTRRDHPNVAVVAAPDGRPRTHCIRINAPPPTFFDTVIRGFLWGVGFHHSPEGRDRAQEDLGRRIAGIDARDADGIHEEDDRRRIGKYRAGLARLARAEEVAIRMGLPTLTQDGCPGGV